MDTVPVQVAEQIVAELVESEHDRYVRSDLISGGIPELKLDTSTDYYRSMMDRWQANGEKPGLFARTVYTGYRHFMEFNETMNSEEAQEWGYRLLRLRHPAGS